MSVKNQNDQLFEEITILNAILNGGRDAYSDCVDLIGSTSFIDVNNALIYEAYNKLFVDNKEFNTTNVLINCNALVGADSDRDNRIREILSNPVDPNTSLRQVANTLRKKRIIKESINTHKKCISALQGMSGSESSSQIFSVSDTALFDLIKLSGNAEDQRPLKLGYKVKELVNYWASNPTINVGIPTPWPKVNESIGGGLRSGVHLFGARSGVGKSSLGICESIFAAEMDIPVLIIDTEMEDKDIMPRMLANISEVEINNIEKGMFAQNDFMKNAVNNAANKLENMEIYHKYLPGSSFEEIMTIIRRWVYSEVGINPDGKANDCLIIYDYFKIMNIGDLSDIAEFQALGLQINSLTDFCKKYGIPCMSFVQLNRDGIDKESTAVISQSDRLLWACNSFSIFKDKTAEEMEKDGWSNGNKKIITLKSRYGGEHVYGQYVSLNMKKNMCIVQETNFTSKKDLDI